MNQPIPTGPDLFAFAEASYGKARSAGSDPDNPTFGSPEELYHFRAAAFHAQQATTAAIVMAVETFANASGADHYDLDGWRSKIGVTYPWDDATFTIDGLNAPHGESGESWEVTYRVPGHVARRESLTEAQVNAEFPHAQPSYRRLARKPEPPHVRIPVGTRVLVSERAIKYPDGRIVYDTQPKVAKVVGYDTFNSKYQLNVERFGGGYYDFVTWAFVDNRVQPHPEQDTAVPAPTGPRVYVRKRSGKQGHIVDLAPEIGDDGLRMVKVQWYTPGCDPVWVRVLDLEIITASEVDRCPNGQTGDECGSGENQCEQCVQADDAEGDMIEESMGLR